MTRGLALVLTFVLFGTALWQSKSPSIAPFATAKQSVAVPPPVSAKSSGNDESTAKYEVRFASSSFHRHVHSSSIAPLPNGGLIAVWFAGSREGAEDVNIRGARFNPASERWGEEFQLISRSTTERILQRDIRKLGNPVIAMGPNKRLWLFYVSVSVGGWAGSAINMMHSDDGGKEWSHPKRLITSPFFNISTLVRNPPVFHQDGSIGLPIYHEFLGKFAEYLYLSPEGEILDKFRISDGEHSLQPAVVPTGENSAVAFLRNAGVAHGKVMVTFSEDRGETWTELMPSQPWNPDSAVAAAGAGSGDGDILVALNDLQDGRFRLSLYQTDKNLEYWDPIQVLDESPVFAERVNVDLFRQGIQNKYMSVARGDAEQEARLSQLMQHVQERACEPEGDCEFKYEYPTIIRTPNGLFHLVYSWNNTLIKHVFFNSAWLEEQS